MKNSPPSSPSPVESFSPGYDHPSLAGGYIVKYIDFDEFVLCVSPHLAQQKLYWNLQYFKIKIQTGTFQGKNSS